MFFIVWAFASYFSLIVILFFMKKHAKKGWLVHEWRRGCVTRNSPVYNLSGKEWSQLALKVVTDPLVIVLQLGNIGVAFIRIVYKLIIIIPALVFWFGVYLFVWEPETFNILTLSDIKDGFTNSAPLLYILSCLLFAVFGVMFVLGKMSSIGFHNYIAERFHKVVKEQLHIPYESIIYMEKSKEKIKAV